MKKEIEIHQKVSGKTVALLILVLFVGASALGFSLYNQIEPEQSLPEDNTNNIEQEKTERFYEVNDRSNLIIDSTRITIPQGYFISTATENTLDDGTCITRTVTECKIFIIQSDDYLQTYYISSGALLRLTKSQLALLQTTEDKVTIGNEEFAVSAYLIPLYEENDDTLTRIMKSQVFVSLSTNIHISSFALSDNPELELAEIDRFKTFVQNLTITAL
jgi:hypothetical protein